MATIQAKNDWNFTEDDITALHDLAAGLEPLELAIKKLDVKVVQETFFKFCFIEMTSFSRKAEQNFLF